MKSVGAGGEGRSAGEQEREGPIRILIYVLVGIIMFLSLAIEDVNVTVELVSIPIGVIILYYVSYCLRYQEVWIRKTLSWGTKEEYPKIFQMNIIGGTLIGLLLIVYPFLV